MFNFFKKKPVSGKTVTLTISGMHCPSCAVNIDGEMEELPGVISSETSYATGKVTAVYDPGKVDVKKMRAVILGLGYKVE